jgi:hypothetical protein
VPPGKKSRSTVAGTRTPHLIQQQTRIDVDNDIIERKIIMATEDLRTSFVK